MLIEMDKYQPNSLRKGRRDALEKDISDGYTLFAYRYNDPRIITSNDFNDFWTASQLNFIPHVVVKAPRFDASKKTNNNTSRSSTAF